MVLQINGTLVDLLFYQKPFFSQKKPYVVLVAFFSRKLNGAEAFSKLSKFGILSIFPRGSLPLPIPIRNELGKVLA